MKIERSEPAEYWIFLAFLASLWLFALWAGM